MLTPLQQTRTRIFQVADASLFATALLAAYFLRNALARWWHGPELPPITDYLWLLPAVAFLGPAVLTGQGFYDPPRATHRLRAPFIILRSCALTVVGVILTLFILHEHLSRSVVVLVGAISGILIYARHEATSWADSRRRSGSGLCRRALWVGLPEENRVLGAALTPAEQATLDNMGEFNPETGAIEDFVRQLHESAINVVILNLPGVAHTQATRVLLACAGEGVEVLVRPGLDALPSPHVTVDHFGGEAVFCYRAQPAAPNHLRVKQLFDYAGATLLLIVLSPLLALLALVIPLASPGPALYRQVRAGLNGRSFPMLKFRAMTLDAAAPPADHAARSELGGPAPRPTNDPRVTPLGRFLYRHRLDELPQLWNVLRGEMSLVGPRPLPIEEVRRFDLETQRRRLSVKPGLTCLWQISGRSDLAAFTDWVRLDLEYIDQWSLWLDFKILVATLPAILFGRGSR